jgi:hypothetical protein
MSVEERVRTAAEESAASVRHVRPLTLPDGDPVSAGPARRRGRTRTKFRQTWLIPLAATAVVAALALTQVALRHSDTPASRPPQLGTVLPPGAVAAIPQYFAVARQGREDHAGDAALTVSIGDIRTGKTVATTSLPGVEVPGNNSAVGASAAADDRTFVVAQQNIENGVAYYLAHLTLGKTDLVTAKRLPIPETAVGVLLGMAVSPNGKELAALSVRGNGTTLKIYSVQSGATLRTWIAGGWKYPGDGEWQSGVSWTADSRQVAFSDVITPESVPAANGALSEFLVSATAPSGDLAAASKRVFAAPANCASLLISPDGGTVVCATMANRFTMTVPAADCAQDRAMYVAYSAATGQRLRTLYQYAGACGSLNTVLWTDDSARHVIGETELSFPGDPDGTDQYGLVTGTAFGKLPVPNLMQWYSGPTF